MEQISAALDLCLPDVRSRVNSLAKPLIDGSPLQVNDSSSRTSGSNISSWMPHLTGHVSGRNEDHVQRPGASRLGTQKATFEEGEIHIVVKFLTEIGRAHV